MATEMVLGIIATDRPGLVERLSRAVADHGGNWIDSSMARLGGEFAGILRVELPDDTVAGFEQELVRLGDEGIAVAVRRGRAAPEPQGHRVAIDLTGADHPGIVRDLSAALARHGVSIDSLATRVFPGSMTGGALFRAHGIAVLPPGVLLEDLRDELEQIAADIMVEIALSEAEDG